MPKRLTMGDIAAKAGTSIGVVSVTLNGAKSKTVRVSDETRRKVILAAQELGYRRDPLAGALATGRANVVGLMLPYVHSFSTPDPFYGTVMAGVASIAEAKGFNLMLYTAVSEEEGKKAAAVIDRRIDGLILVIPPCQSPLFAECERQGISVVAVSSEGKAGHASVRCDDYQGALLATEHLIGLGHRRIAHLAGNPQIGTSLPRQTAYESAMRFAGLSTDREWVREGRFNREISHRSTQALLRLPKNRRPTAIVAANDLSAHGAIDAVQEAGLRVPEDVSVVGFDDTWYCSITNPPLTSVNANVERMGRCAAETLIATIEGEPFEALTVLPVSLTVRRSSGPPKTC